MKPINYRVPLIKQGPSECLQASVAQLLDFYKLKKPLDNIKKDIPVYKDSDGKLLGTSIGHIANYLLNLGLEVKLHVVDTEIFDISWESLSIGEICNNLEKRKKYVKHHRYNKETLDYIIDGYIMFFKKGGKINFPIIDTGYLYELLTNGPFIALVNSNFLHRVAKASFPTESNQISVPDSIKGSTFTHAIVISGYDSLLISVKK